MCGIVGAVAQRNVVPILIEGLRKLEYRGYDSAGLALLDPEGHMNRVRAVGRVAELDTRRDEGRMREDVRRLNPAEADTPEWVDTLSLRVTSLVRRTGIDLSSLTGDLAVVGRSLERHMVTSVFLGLGGFAAPLFVVALMQIMGAPLGWSVPLLLSVALGVVDRTHGVFLV